MKKLLSCLIIVFVMVIAVGCNAIIEEECQCARCVAYRAALAEFESHLADCPELQFIYLDILEFKTGEGFVSLFNVEDNPYKVFYNKSQDDIITVSYSESLKFLSYKSAEWMEGYSGSEYTYNAPISVNLPIFYMRIGIAHKDSDIIVYIEDTTVLTMQSTDNGAELTSCVIKTDDNYLAVKFIVNMAAI